MSKVQKARLKIKENSRLNHSAIYILSTCASSFFSACIVFLCSFCTALVFVLHFHSFPSWICSKKPFELNSFGTKKLFSSGNCWALGNNLDIVIKSFYLVHYLLFSSCVLRLCILFFPRAILWSVFLRYFSFTARKICDDFLSIEKALASADYRKNITCI